MDEDEFDEDDDFDIPQMDNSVVTQKLNTSRLARNDAAKVENTDVATDGDEDAGKVITLDAFRKK